MREMGAYFPAQKLNPDTAREHIADWLKIAERYGMDRFENALGNVRRSSEFFPLPKRIEDECRALQAMVVTIGASMGVYQCGKCGNQQASGQPKACHACGGFTTLVATSNPADSDREMAEYVQALREHPEEFVSLNSLFREAKTNVARKRMQA